MRAMFAQMRRARFDTGVWLNKLSAAMIDAMLHLPPSVFPR